MKILALIPKTKDEEAGFVLEATEAELDKIRGITDIVHIAGRYKVGNEINPATVYDKLEYFTKNKARLKQAIPALRNTADSIEGLLPEE